MQTVERPRSSLRAVCGHPAATQTRQAGRPAEAGGGRRRERCRRGCQPHHRRGRALSLLRSANVRPFAYFSLGHTSPFAAGTSKADTVPVSQIAENVWVVLSDRRQNSPATQELPGSYCTAVAAQCVRLCCRVTGGDGNANHKSGQQQAVPDGGLQAGSLNGGSRIALMEEVFQHQQQRQPQQNSISTAGEVDSMPPV